MNYVAMDIGGSAIKAGIINSKGQVLKKTSIPTPMGCLDDLIDVLSGIVEWAMKETEINGIALSQPCATDSVTGEALSEGSLIYIKDTNPSKILGEKFALPYAAANDGNCAALAEVWIGNAKEVSNVALVVCGTGIGGSVLIDQKIVDGKNNFAGEFGMFVTGFDEARNPVIWSANGSTKALVDDYAKRSGKDSKSLDGKAVFSLSDAGDPVAMACVADFFKIFAYGVHDIQHAFDPDVILVGGAISARPDFVARINEALDVLYTQLRGLMSRPSLSVCACGSDANMIGAVYHLLSTTNID
ncbi:MAG: ROK family protein [Clostridiales bacterium]|nr:ROK family protein [Clostridiales bacterium]